MKGVVVLVVLAVALVLALVFAFRGTAYHGVPTTTPEQAFCDQAVPLLSQEHDMAREPETAARNQMDELARVAEILPEDQEEPLLVLIDGLTTQLRLFEQGRAEDGWDSFDVVEYVGSLCDRDDLTWWMVVP